MKATPSSLLVLAAFLTAGNALAQQAVNPPIEMDLIARVRK